MNLNKVNTVPNKILILVILLIATILSPLDFYIVNLALTPIQKNLNTSSGQMQMIVSFYTCAYAIFQIIGGRLGDLLGQKKIFLTGLLGFVVASAICGLAINVEILIFGRILQGISGAILAPQVLAIIHVTFDEKEKTKVMAWYSFTFGLAAILGQYLGGFLISYNLLGLGWRVIFLMNIPIGLIAWFGAAFLFPRTKVIGNKNIDILGILLLSISLGLIVYPLTLLSENGWNISIICMLFLSLVLIAFFICYQKTLKTKGRLPLIDLAVFKHRNLRIGSIVAFLFYCSGVFYMTLSIYLQEGQAWNAMETGSAIIPFGIGFLISSLSSAFIAKWIGNKILNVGILVKVTGFLMIIYSLSLINPTFHLFYAGLFLVGCGMALVLSCIARISLKGIPNEYAGLASGVINCALQIGSAIGVAGIGSVFFSMSKLNGYTLAFQSTLAIVVVLLLIASGIVLWNRKTKKHV